VMTMYSKVLLITQQLYKPDDALVK